MDFINIILANSLMKEAKLQAAAKRASQNPLIGITIQNQAAYHVIKDCATITSQYLPFFIFSGYAQPFVELAGKFKRQHIVDFVVGCKTNKVLKQFLDMLLFRIQQETNCVVPAGSQANPTKTFETASQNDPYGDYAFYMEEPVEQQPITEVTNNPVDILIEAFKVTD
jgi:hypothetical protein